MKKNVIYKRVEYAYPTSKYANSVGMGKTGCFYVQQYITNIEGSGQTNYYTPPDGEPYLSVNDPDLRAYFEACDGKICPDFIKYGNPATLVALDLIPDSAGKLR